MGDMSYLQELPKRYEQCQKEDWDLTPTDFIIEHLLNLEEVIECFETKSTNTSEKDKPHQANFSHNIAPFFSLSVVQHKINTKPSIQFYKKIKYPIMDTANAASNFLSDIFHPPTV
jgi:hypothetical protein